VTCHVYRVFHEWYLMNSTELKTQPTIHLESKRGCGHEKYPRLLSKCFVGCILKSVGLIYHSWNTLYIQRRPMRYCYNAHVVKLIICTHANMYIQDRPLSSELFTILFELLFQKPKSICQLIKPSSFMLFPSLSEIDDSAWSRKRLYWLNFKYILAYERQIWCSSYKKKIPKHYFTQNNCNLSTVQSREKWFFLPSLMKMILSSLNLVRKIGVCITSEENGESKLQIRKIKKIR
jgi:hypothetical protein